MTRQTGPDLEQGLRTPVRTSQPHVISPADTFDTALTSPTTFDTIDLDDHTLRQAPPKPQKISFEHNIKTSSKSRGGSCLFGISKPVLGLTLLFLAAAAAAAYLLNGWLGIPQLKEEIERLEVEVDRLNFEVNRLSAENDRYEALNDQLYNTVAELTNITISLNETVIELEDVSDALNVTNQELGEQVDELTELNENYAQLNDNLNNTAKYLAAEVEVMRETLEKLILENENLANVTDSLEAVKDHLTDITMEQNETLAEFKETLANFTAENDRLEGLNSDLLTLVNFLNATSLGLDDSLEAITGFLSSQIEANQVLVIETLENSFRQRVASWDCQYRDVFREEPFGSDFNAPITNVDTVLTYVDDRVLSELCLDKEDFVQYISSQYPLGLTSYRLISGVVKYTTEALDYYFPEEDETGLSLSDWQDASFACKNLPSTYKWS